MEKTEELNNDMQDESAEDDAYYLAAMEEGEKSSFLSAAEKLDFINFLASDS